MGRRSLVKNQVLLRVANQADGKLLGIPRTVYLIVLSRYGYMWM